VHALSKPIGNIKRADEMAVASILKSKGWDRKNRIIGGSPRWVYVRPDGQKPKEEVLAPKKSDAPQQAIFEGLDDEEAAKWCSAKGGAI
jgi:hypothetical protein